MPTYDYVCDACEHEFELFQSITEASKRKCPECGRMKLRRRIGPGAAIVFKGSGFYKTDYRSESYRKAAAADQGGSKSKEKDGGSKKSDAKKTAGGSAATAGS